MVQFSAFRRLARIFALVICAAALVVFVTPASARPGHGKGYHANAGHSVHHVKRHHVKRHHIKKHHRHRHHLSRHRGRHHARALRVRHDARQQRAIVGDSSAYHVAQSRFGSSNIVAEARRYIGGNPTGRRSLWCARFMNMVLQRSGHKGTGSDMARSFANYGQRISGPQIGAIAVMSRGRRGGHVGVVSGIDAKGNPIVVSGNHGRRVAESVYSRGRVYAYVMPSS